MRQGTAGFVDEMKGGDPAGPGESLDTGACCAPPPSLN